MKWCIKSLVAAAAVLDAAFAAQAQQPGNNGNNNGGNAKEGVQPQGEIRNAPVELQRNQQGPQARAPQRQNIAPFGNRNNRDPREDAERRRQDLANRGLDPQGNQLQLEGQNQGGGQGQPNQGQGGQGGQESAFTGDLLGGGGGSSSGGGGGVVTVEQASGMATAQVITSAGQFNRDSAAAYVLNEKAHDQAITNNYKQVSNYFDVRQLNRQESRIARGRKPTPEDLQRYSQSRIPERLSLAELNRETGAIHWPASLREVHFADHRARLEQIFQGRSYDNSGLASTSYLEIKEEVSRMLFTLQDYVYAIEPSAYLQARKFIASLGDEGRFVATEVALRG